MHKKMWMKKNKRGEMGVGTMIIFIAMVLVAAVAASVLISTANSVREQAQTTGDSAINGVASGFVVQDVVGKVNSSTYKTIDELTVFVRLSAGSPPISMDNVYVTMVSDNIKQSMMMSPTTANGTAYKAELSLAISGYEWSTNSHVVGQGDLIKMTITSQDGTLGIGFNQDCTIKIMPAYGQQTLVMFKTGEAFANEYITLA
jgi:flagellin FlaB